MQFFNFTLRFGQVSWDLKVPLRISEERETPYQPPVPLRGYALGFIFFHQNFQPRSDGAPPDCLNEKSARITDTTTQAQKIKNPLSDC